MVRAYRSLGVLLMVLATSGGTQTPEPPSESMPPAWVPPPPGPPAVAEPVQFMTTEPVDPPAPCVKIKVRVPACAHPVLDLKYCITVENCTTAEAHHVVVKNKLPKNVTLIKSDPEPVKKEGELHWNIGTLGGKASREITLVLRATDKEDIKNCFRVQYEHGQCVTTRHAGFGPSVGEPGKGDAGKEPGKEKGKEPGKIDSKEPGKVIPPPPDPNRPAKLRMSIDGPVKQYLNLPARYFLTVTNEGIGPAGNTLVTLHLADKTDFVKASDEGKFLAGQVAWLIGTLEVGATRTVVVEVKAKAMGEWCQKGEALADGGISAKAEKCTLFVGVSALLLEMVDRDDPIEVGGETSYAILIRNQGQVPVTNIILKAVVGEGLLLTRAKGPADHHTGARVARGQELLFNPLPSLEPGAETTYEVFVKGALAGDRRFRIEMTADQLGVGGPVAEEESTAVFAADGVLLRSLSRPVAYRPLP